MLKSRNFKLPISNTVYNPKNENSKSFANSTNN